MVTFDHHTNHCHDPYFSCCNGQPTNQQDTASKDLSQLDLSNAVPLDLSNQPATELIKYAILEYVAIVTEKDVERNG
jgi:hypothetical protein